MPASQHASKPVSRQTSGKPASQQASTASQQASKLQGFICLMAYGLKICNLTKVP
jgi:hypothetical protein